MTNNSGDYVAVEVGNWFTVYECKHCKRRLVEQPDSGPWIMPDTKCTTCEIERSNNVTEAENTNPTYKEFIADCRRELSDALIKEGLAGMCDKFEFVLMPMLKNIESKGGFKQEIKR